MKISTDEDLVRNIREGDVYAFETLVRRYQKRIHVFVMRQIRDHQAAQDVVQETFIKFYEHIDRFDLKRKVSPYIYAIARNTVVSFIRLRKPHVSLEHAEELPDPETPESAAVRKEGQRQVKEAIATLDTKYKKAVSLYYLEDLSYQEISKALMLPVNTIRTHIRRAKALLKEILYERI